MAICQHCNFWVNEVCCNGDSLHCSEFTGRLDGCKFSNSPPVPLAAIPYKDTLRCPRCYSQLPGTRPESGQRVERCPDCGNQVIYAA